MDTTQYPMENFGPYRPIRLLGEGGMGVVWLAERTDTRTFVAIKFLPNAGLSPARLERFAQEVKLLARLKHPNIARLYDAGTMQDGTPWFAMEYVEGIVLREYVGGLHSLEEKLKLFRSVCEAVQYAHSHAVIHRDLKPSNIFVEADGTPKLLDFGIARELRPAGDESGLTVRGPQFISPRYSAPEWSQLGVVGFSTDVYSLGVMLYEMLTGHVPDDSSTGQREVRASSGEMETARVRPSSVVRAIGQSVPHPGIRRNATSLSRSAWNDLDVLCLKAIHTDPARRYGSVEALIRDIDHFFRREPLEARPDSWLYRASMFVRRNATSVVLGASALILIVSMASAFAVRLAEARNAALTDAARSNRIRQFTLNLFKSTATRSKEASNPTIEALADRGTEDSSRFAQEPELQASLFEVLGQMYVDIGVPSKAAPLYSRALAIREQMPHTPASPRFSDEIQLGLVESVQNRLDEAERLIRDAGKLLASDPRKDIAGRAEFEGALGSVLTSKGRYAEAEPHLKFAISLQDSLPQLKHELADNLAELAIVELDLGHYEESDMLNLRLLALDSELYGRHTRWAMDAYQGLGTSAYIRGELEIAERDQRNALKIAEAWYGTSHRNTANQRVSLANVLTDEGKLAEAGPLLRDSIAIENKVLPPGSTYMGKALHYLGRYQAARGQFSLALYNFDLALTAFQKNRGPNDFVVGVTLLSKGSTCLKMGDRTHAENSFRRALQIILAARGENDIYTALARIQLGHVLLLERRASEALQLTQAGLHGLKNLHSVSTSLIDPAEQDLHAEQQAIAEVARLQTPP